MKSPHEFCHAFWIGLLTCMFSLLIAWRSRELNSIASRSALPALHWLSECLRGPENLEVPRSRNTMMWPFSHKRQLWTAVSTHVYHTLLCTVPALPSSMGNLCCTIIKKWAFLYKNGLAILACLFMHFTDACINLRVVTLLWLWSWLSQRAWHSQRVLSTVESCLSVHSISQEASYNHLQKQLLQQHGIVTVIPQGNHKSPLHSICNVVVLAISLIFIWQSTVESGE